MYRALAGATVALSLFSVVSVAQASGLSSFQIQAIIGLLQSFGADQTTITTVESALQGTTASSTPAHSNTSCVNLSHNLFFGQTDAQTDGDVSNLQQFLGFASTTGFFGSKTELAVQQWQSTHSVVSSGSSNTSGFGYVGPRTRGALGCHGTASTTTTAFAATPVTGTAPLLVTFTGVGSSIAFGDGLAQTTSGDAGVIGTTTHTYTTAGTYTASIKGSSVVITVTAPHTNTATTTPTATIDQNSLTSFPTNTTISGTASNVTQLTVSVSIPQTTGGIYCNAQNVPVVNGVWSIAGTAAICSQALPTQPTYQLSALVGNTGNYMVTVYAGTTKLATGALTTATSTTVTGVAPTISGVSPVSAPAGQSVTVTGTGFTSSNTVSIGTYSVGPVSSSNGTTLTFTVPSTTTAGSYTLSVSSLTTGATQAIASNGIPFTIVAGTVAATAAITSSLTSTSGTPTISGTAANTTAVSVSITSSSGTSVFTSGSLAVSNGAWTTSVTPALAAGTYTVTVRDGSNNSLTTGQLTIGSTNTGVAPTISSVSPMSVPAGQSVTVTGTGFTSSNTVSIGTYSVGPVSSSNGTTLTFTVPSTATAGSYTLTVNSLTTGSTLPVASNGVPFSVTAGNSNQNNNNNNNNNSAATAAITSSLTSTTGTPTISGTAANTTVVNVSVTSSTGSVAFTSGSVTVSSGNWTTTVAPALAAGTYTVTVSDGSGHSLTTGQLTVTSGGSNSTTPSATITSQTAQTSGTFQVTGTLTNTTALNVFLVSSTYTGPTNYGSVVNLSGSIMVNATISGQTWTAAFSGVANGSYKVYVYNPSSLALLATGSVTVNATAAVSVPTLTQVSPTSVTAGQSVTLTGTGFTSTNNTVLIGGTPVGTVSSSDGQTLTVPIPNATQAGTYTLTVTNANGTTATGLQLTVTTGGSTANAPSTPAAPLFTCSPDGTQVTLSWSSVWGSNASSYGLRVSSPNFTSISSCPSVLNAYNNGACSQSTTVTSEQVSITPGASYTASVNASNMGGTSNWSSPTSFSCAPGASTPVVTLSPSPRTISLSAGPQSSTITWGVTNVFSCQLGYYTNSSGGSTGSPVYYQSACTNPPAVTTPPYTAAGTFNTFVNYTLTPGGPLFTSVNMPITVTGVLPTTNVCPSGYSGTYPNCSTTISNITSATAFWTSLYYCIQNKAPDAGGLSYWVNQTTATPALSAYRDFFEVPAYTNLNTSNAAFVNQLYSCILYRPYNASSDGTYWLDSLNNGFSRDSAIQSFLLGTEFLTKIAPTLRQAGLQP